VDNDNPSIQITSPQEGSIINTNTVNVTWTGSDANSGIDHYEIRIDSSSWIDVGTTTSYQFTNLNDGDHTVEVKAVDKAGNEMTDNVSFTVDTTSPTVEITSPTSGSIYNTSDISVVWSGSDTTSGIDHYEIKLDSNNWINVGTNTTYTFINVPDGNHQISVKVVDKAGNTAVDAINVIIDKTPPTLEIISPTNGTILSNQTVTIKWNSSDATTGIDHFEIKIDDGNWVNVGKNTSYRVYLSVGKHTIIVKAVDNAENSATSKINIEISAPAGGGSGEGGETTNPSGKATNWLLIILALIVIIVVAGIIFALLRKSHRTQETKEVQEEKEGEKEETQKEDEKEEKRD